MSRKGREGADRGEKKATNGNGGRSTASGDVRKRLLLGSDHGKVAEESILDAPAMEVTGDCARNPQPLAGTPAVETTTAGKNKK